MNSSFFEAVELRKQLNLRNKLGANSDKNSDKREFGSTINAPSLQDSELKLRYKHLQVDRLNNMQDETSFREKIVVKNEKKTES